ncbi:MAG TPA: hypothetical protein VEQ15_16240 [Myxococcales bacterium]|jgi:hypothetical protein|nr:hypothetical protein [Myxococcales bacterium]
MNGIHLSRLPLSAKVFCSLFLLGIGCGALAAFAQAATAVGVSPSAVRESLAPELPMTGMRHGEMSAEQEIDLGELSRTAKVWMRTPLLIQTSHTHLFGQTLIAGLLGLIFLFVPLREGAKAAIVALPFVGTLVDIGGMWATRFISPSLGVLVIAGGTLFALGYVLIAALSMHDLWLRKETA